MRGKITVLVLTGVLASVLAGGSVYLWVFADDGGASGVNQGSPVERGRTLFQSKGCVGCHQIAGVESGRSIGPDLTELHDVAGSRIDGVSAESYVVQSIAAPDAYVVDGYGYGMQTMPEIAMTRAEMDALVAFLLSDHERAE